VSIENGLRVFVVDDEKVISSTLAVILRQSGFLAEPFTDPIEALRLAASKCPDLLISDVMMPGMTGVELAVQMQSRCRECKVLLFSGQAATADLLEDSRKKGHNFKLLEKPVHPADLLEALRGLHPPPAH
jgi:CheY-like chemotaxis protein